MTTRPTPAADHTPAYDVATLTTCDTEPIHIPGAIQPHGVLLALDLDLRVVMASANTDTLLGHDVEEVIGMTAAELVGSDLAATIRRRVVGGFPLEPLVLVLGRTVAGSLAGREVDVHVHGSGSGRHLRIVVEIEPLVPVSGSEVTYKTARSAMTRLARAGDVVTLADLLATEVRQISGFDRVMVYRFDEFWNGEVIAEARRADLNPFLGLHYPATDIPAQARRLYTVNPIRLIADIGYTPVPLHPILDFGTGAPLDLSHASLRSVSPIHVEYLTNMGVGASMSVSIIIDDQLWGLIACHHYSGSHRPSQDARSTCEFVTSVASHLIAHRERAEARDAAVSVAAEMAALTTRLTATDADILASMTADPATLGIFGATGLAVHFDGELRTEGTVPPPEVLHRIAEVLDVPDRYAVSTSHLAGHDPDLAAYDEIGAGVLRLGSMPGRWCLWFRPEQRQIVDWGGDPSNKRLYDAEDPSVRLSPRKSFDKWQEDMRGHSEPWHPWHCEAAEELGRHVNSLLTVRAREQVAMAESMQRNVVLDRAPGFDGVELVARYRPASTYQLGGDWWDAFELADGRLAFVVGDVAGHGVAAASAMTQARTALRAYLYEGHGPGAALDRLDVLMDGLLDVGIATAVVTLFDPLTGRLEIGNAGHPPPMVVAGGGGARLVQAEVRPLLGVGFGSSSEHGPAPTAEFTLEPGEMLVLYTDGLVERRGFDLGERTERFRVLVGTRRSGEDLEAWADRVLDTLGTTDDDTTLLGVRRPG